MLVLWGALSVIFGLAAVAMVLVHTDIHSENKCGMTYMYRSIYYPPIIIEDNNVSTYSFHRYYEGSISMAELEIGANDIPVLFIPGSGGSGKQVRSVASVMLNKTLITKAPFRMQFYSVDFDEELSFLSGDILRRQREFVVQVLKKLDKMYAKANSKKVILIGHSFGGVVVKSLPTHPSVDVSKMDLIITLAAPLDKPPLKIDESMALFYREMKQIWELRSEELSHIGILSYSGGEKDFQVPDALSNTTEVFPLPSWSIRGVDTGCDHLCILWCNQLVRHVTRVLWGYGLEQSVDISSRQTGRDVLQIFLEEQRKVQKVDWRTDTEYPDEVPLSSGDLPSLGSIGVFENPTVPWVYTGRMKSSRATRSLILLPDVAVRLLVESQKSCTRDIVMEYEYPNGMIAVSRFWNLHFGHQFFALMILPQPRLQAGNSRLLIKGNVGCEYRLTVGIDPFTSWYLTVLENLHLVAHFFLLAITTAAIFESFFGAGMINDQLLLLVLLWITLKGPIAFYMNNYIFEYLLITTVILLLTASIMVSKLLMWIISKLPRSVTSVISISLTAILVPFGGITLFINPYISCAIVAILNGILLGRPASSRNVMSVCTALVLGAIGLSSVQRNKSVDVMQSLIDYDLSSLQLSTASAQYPVQMHIALLPPMGALFARLLRLGSGDANQRLTLRTIITFFTMGIIVPMAFKPEQSLEMTAVLSTTILIIIRFINQFSVNTVPVSSNTPIRTAPGNPIVSASHSDVR